MSSCVMRPPGPVPRTVEGSMPRSSAIRRASGVMRMRPSRDGAPAPLPSPGDATVVVVAGDCAGEDSSARACCLDCDEPRLRFTSAASSPFVAITAIAPPTFTLSPSFATMAASVPLSVASHSIVALSVSTSASTSPTANTRE
jgi:hypothetical protein